MAWRRVCVVLTERAAAGLNRTEKKLRVTKQGQADDCNSELRARPEYISPALERYVGSSSLHGLYAINKVLSPRLTFAV
jgi:hypothetical protein